MNRSPTTLLSILLLLASVSAWMAYSRLQTMRGAALASERDLQSCRRDLLLIAAAGAASTSANAPNESQLDQLLNGAASDAGTRLSSIEPGTASERPQAGFVDMAVFLRLDALSLRQLATFLRVLHDRAPATRAKLIELATPQAPSTQGADVWAADVTINYRSASGAHTK